MEESLSYQEVYLVPRYTEVESRSNVDVGVWFLGKKWKLPVVPANMVSVISTNIAKWMSENGYFYIMHRFGDNKEFVKRANEENWNTISISVGVKSTDWDFIEWLFHNTNHRVDFVTIDVAHGHSQQVKDTIRHIRSHFDDRKPRIIAGNVATPQAVNDLAVWGADAAKVGIAGGGVCSTKTQTGFHVPMFSCIRGCFSSVIYLQNEIYPTTTPIPIIADGGIRNNGDIAKAIRAGATMVMAGSIFAACIDSPAEFTHEDEKRKYKSFFGSASQKNKLLAGQEVRNIEGFEAQIPCNNLMYKQKLLEIEQSLQSACSYAGSSDLNGLKSVDYVKVGKN